MRHRLDPPAAHATAALLGRLAAAGLTDWPDARALLAPAIAAAGAVDRSGLAARLAHAFADARADAARHRRFAGRRIRTALAPLLDAGAGRESILAAAEAAGDDSLLPGEAHALAVALVAERLQRCNQ